MSLQYLFLDYRNKFGTRPLRSFRSLIQVPKKADGEYAFVDYGEYAFAIWGELLLP